MDYEGISREVSNCILMKVRDGEIFIACDINLLTCEPETRALVNGILRLLDAYRGKIQ